MLKYQIMFKSLIVSILFTLSLNAAVFSVAPKDRLQFANQLVKRGLYSEAVKEYEVIRDVGSVPRDEVTFRLAEAYAKLGRTAEALNTYKELLVEFPSSKFVDYARLNRAQILKGDARFEELKALDRNDVKVEIRSAALFYLGESSEAKGDTKAAIAYYTRSIEAKSSGEIANLARLRSAMILSKSAEMADRRRALGIYLDLTASEDKRLAEEALFFAAVLGYHDGRYSEAASLFGRLRELYPGSSRAQESEIFAAWSSFMSGRFTESLKLASALRESGNEDAYYLTASSLKRLSRFSDALAAYDEALRVYPNGKYADAEWFEKLEVLNASGNSQGVLDALGSRKNLPTNISSRAWNYGCDAAIAVTNYHLAIEYALQVAKDKSSPLAANGMLRLAWLQERVGNWKEAAKSYAAVSDSPAGKEIAPQALYQAGVAEIKAGRPDVARSYWTKLLTRYPQSSYAAKALYSRAMEELRNKDYRAANASLTQLRKRFPNEANNADVCLWCGIAARGSGDEPEAEKHYRKALTLKPSAEVEREVKLELATVLQRRGEDKEASQIYAELLSTKAIERLTPSVLEWVAGAMLSVSNYNAALTAAEVLEKRNIDSKWNQIAAELQGEVYEMQNQNDAAVSAYERALKTGARTFSGAKAALALGKLDTERGEFDRAKEILSDAVSRSQSQEYTDIRVKAYAALAENEEARGDVKAAYGYHLLVGTLFDDKRFTPYALYRVSEILKEQGKTEDAEKFSVELKKRYPKFKAEKGVAK